MKRVSIFCGLLLTMLHVESGFFLRLPTTIAQKVATYYIAKNMPTIAATLTLAGAGGLLGAMVYSSFIKPLKYKNRWILDSIIDQARYYLYNPYDYAGINMSHVQELTFYCYTFKEKAAAVLLKEKLELAIVSFNNHGVNDVAARRAAFTDLYCVINECKVRLGIPIATLSAYPSCVYRVYKGLEKNPFLLCWLIGLTMVMGSVAYESIHTPAV